MNQFATNLSVQNDDRLLRQSSRSDLSAYRETPYEFPYGNIILNLFNNEVPLVSVAFVFSFSLSLSSFLIIFYNKTYYYYLLLFINIS